MDKRKDEPIQKSVEVLSVLACILGIGTVFFFGGAFSRVQTGQESAANQSRVLAYSVWQMELNRTERFSSEDKPADRSLASREGLSGIVGLDPWKKPYRYEFLKNNQFLVVWSAGPNGRWDSLQTLPQLRGDDIGHLVDLNLNH